MKRIFIPTVILSFALLGLALAATAGVPGVMTYQGRLTEDGAPVNDTLPMTFTIYEDSSGLYAIWTENQNDVIVTNGLFTVLLGSVYPLADTVFDDTARWLGVSIDGGAEIIPRARLGGVPYAYRVSTVDGATGGIISGDVAIQSDLDVDGELRVTGKATIGPGHTNTGIRAFVAGEDNTASERRSTVSGGQGNTAGGWYSAVSGGQSNAATGFYSTVGGGLADSAKNHYSTVGGGESNKANGDWATIAGGHDNAATDTGSTVGGGNGNTASGDYSTICGGLANAALDCYSTVGGGLADSAKNPGSTVSGGGVNKANGDYATVAGGYSNVAWGEYAMVAGGYSNRAHGNYSFAAGRQAKAMNNGTFVWADQEGGDFESTGPNQFLIRASGGVGIGTNDPGDHTLFVTSDGAGPDGSTIYAVNTLNDATGGPALFARAHGTSPPLSVDQRGTGDIIHGRSSGSLVFQVTNCGQVVAPVVQITGGCDLAEPFPMSDQAAIPEGALVVIDDKNPGQLKLSDRPYDTRVAGIVSGAGGMNPGITLSKQEILGGGRNVALSGRVYAFADASYGAIKPGDLLTTSDTPGHAMKANDRDRAYGAVIGKAMTALEQGQGLVLVLVNLQ